MERNAVEVRGGVETICSNKTSMHHNTHNNKNNDNNNSNINTNHAQYYYW